MGILIFFRPRSLDLSQDVDAALTWGGVGWGGGGGCQRSPDFAQDFDAASMGWDGMGR